MLKIILPFLMLAFPAPQYINVAFNKGGGSGPITLVSQCVSATAQGTGTSIACSTTMNLAAGNTVAVFVRGGDSTASVSSVTEGTNTYTAADTLCSGAAFGIIQWWYAKNISAVSNATITVNFTGTPNFRSVWASQWSGPSTTAPLDAHPNCATGTSTSPLTGTFSTVNANEVLLAGVNVASTTETYTAGSGYTLGTGVADQDSQTEYQIVSSIQTNVTAGFTLGTSNAWAIMPISLTK